MFDLSHPFFNPLWRRVVIVVLCLGWALFEFATGAPFWGMLFGAVGLWCAWSFFVKFTPHPEDEEDDPNA